MLAEFSFRPVVEWGTARLRRAPEITLHLRGTKSPIIRFSERIRGRQMNNQTRRPRTVAIAMGHRTVAAGNESKEGSQRDPRLQKHLERTTDCHHDGGFGSGFCDRRPGEGVIGHSNRQRCGHGWTAWKLCPTHHQRPSNRALRKWQGSFKGMADRMETYAEDLRDQSVDDFAADSLELHQKHPALVFGLAALAGFFALRTIKSASSPRRGPAAGEYHGA